MRCPLFVTKGNRPRTATRKDTLGHIKPKLVLTSVTLSKPFVSFWKGYRLIAQTSKSLRFDLVKILSIKFVKLEKHCWKTNALTRTNLFFSKAQRGKVLGSRSLKPHLFMIPHRTALTAPSSNQLSPWECLKHPTQLSQDGLVCPTSCYGLGPWTTLLPDSAFRLQRNLRWSFDHFQWKLLHLSWLLLLPRCQCKTRIDCCSPSFPTSTERTIWATVPTQILGGWSFSKNLPWQVPAPAQKTSGEWGLLGETRTAPIVPTLFWSPSQAPSEKQIQLRGLSPGYAWEELSTVLQELQGWNFFASQLSLFSLNWGMLLTVRNACWAIRPCAKLSNHWSLPLKRSASFCDVNWQNFEAHITGNFG